MAGGEKADKCGTGFRTCSVLVVGNMVGSGVFPSLFSLTAFGGLSLFSWLVSSTDAALLALTFARLTQVNPDAGDPYAYTRDGFGSFAGYLYTWTYWKAAWIGNAAIAVAPVDYLRVFVPALADPLLMVCVTIAAIWLCALISLRGISTFSVMQNLLAILRLLPLLLVGILGWFHFNPEYLTIPAHSELSDMGYAQATATTAVLTLWSFIGLESATVPAGDVEDPRRTIPRATLFGMLAAVTLYILSITAMQGLMPPEVLVRSISPFADAARILMGNWDYYLVAAGAVVACLGVLSDWVLLQGQIPVAPTRDGLFPESLGQLNKNGTPARDLLTSGLLVTALVMVDGHDDLVGVFNMTVLLSAMTGMVPYVFCTATLLQLLAVRPDEFSPHSRRQLLVIGSLGFAYSLWALYGTGWQAIFQSFLVLMAGIPMYTWRQWRSRVSGMPTLKAND